MESNFSEYLTLDKKKAEETYGKKDQTYPNMIRSFYDNVLNQNLTTIHEALLNENHNYLKLELDSLIAAGKYLKTL